MPSKVILEQKQQAVAELAEQIKNSVSGVLVNYQGILCLRNMDWLGRCRTCGNHSKVHKEGEPDYKQHHCSRMPYRTSTDGIPNLG